MTDAHHGLADATDHAASALRHAAGLVQRRLPAPGARGICLVASGRGDVPLVRLRFRCSNCGSDHTRRVITGKGATAVQPWRSLPA